MEFALKKKNPLIIEGFPGFGLVGTIASEFLIEHLKCECVGSIWFDKLPATLAIHDGKLIKPIGIYYNEEFNILIIHGLLAAKGLEWKIAEKILEMADHYDAREIISLEGVGSSTQAEPKVFFFSNHEEINSRLKGLGFDEMEEGIVIGVSSALLLKSQKPISCLFAETHSQLPDAKAAAKLIEALDKYLGLNVDYKPLLKQAKEFEKKLRGILEQSMEAEKVRDKKTLSYVG